MTVGTGRFLHGAACRTHGPTRGRGLPRPHPPSGGHSPSHPPWALQGRGGPRGGGPFSAHVQPVGGTRPGSPQDPKGHEPACPALLENSHQHRQACRPTPCTRGCVPCALAPAPVLGTPQGPRGSRWVLCAPSTVPPFQRQEAGLLLVRGQVRAAAPGRRRQGRRRRAVLQRRGQLAAA